MKVRIGTRGSRLALWQAERVAGLIAEQGHEAELVVIRTTGDRRRDVPLAEIGGKGMFIREIEEALLEGRVDLAVHSLKDVPSILPEEMLLAAFPERADPRDVWLSRTGASPDELTEGSVVATGAPRRRAQLLARWPHLKVEGVRGNVDTRIALLESGRFDAMMLASAGLRRLALAEESRYPLDVDLIVPAAGQGILAVEILRERDDLAVVARGINHVLVEREALAERRVLELFGAALDCHSAIAVHARQESGTIRLDAFVGSETGGDTIRESVAGDCGDWEALAAALHEQLVAAGAADLLFAGGAA